MHKIMIVEDDMTIANAIKEHLTVWNHEVHLVTDFQKVLNDFVSFDPHLILLDISLPFYNGYYWCGEIRKLSKVPVIFISSATDNMNIVMAMNMGGDDFIAKPFDLDVLTAKIQALLRRAYDFGQRTSFLEHRGAILNMSDTTLSYDNQKISLTKNDYKILQTLMENKGKIVSRDTLMTKLWETDCYVDENTLTINISRLRKKLDQAGLTNFITTRKGLGYVIEDEKL